MDNSDWIEEASRAIKERALPQVESEVFARPSIGDIRIARPMDLGDVPSRLVCVVDVDPRLGFVKAVLLTNEVDNATDVDCELHPEDTALPFSLLAHGDIQVPLFSVQVDGLVGSVSHDLVRIIADALVSEGSEIPASRRGLPIRNQSDLRWPFKEDELEVAQQLAAECALWLARHHGEDRGEIDPAMLGYPGDEPSAQRRRILSLASLSSAEWALSPESVLELIRGGALSLQSDCTSSELGVDACYALMASIQKLLPSAGLSFATVEYPIEAKYPWHVESHPSQTKALSRVLSQCAESGIRSLRLGSASDLWEVPLGEHGAMRASVYGKTIQLIAVDIEANLRKEDDSD